MEHERVRLFQKRNILVWITKQGTYNHWGVMFGYITESSQRQKGRKHYQIDIFKNSREVYLEFSTPIEETAKYGRLEAQYEIQTSLAEIQVVAMDVFETFGDYNKFTNNCQDYATKLVQALVSQLGMIAVDNSSSTASQILSAFTAHAMSKDFIHASTPESSEFSARSESNLWAPDNRDRDSFISSRRSYSRGQIVEEEEIGLLEDEEEVLLESLNGISI